MKSIYEKLRTARVELGFSQGYVAECLGIGRSADEIEKFCKLYHLSADYLLNSEVADNPKTAVFARGFDELSENDQQEILNLIAFKKAMANR